MRMSGVRAGVVALSVALGASYTPVRAQAYRPPVALSVTPSGGHLQQFQTVEGGLVTLTVSGRTYGFRPTMLDDNGTRYLVSIFDMGNATQAVRELGDVEVRGGAPAVSSGTTPAFRIEARKSSGGTR